MPKRFPRERWAEMKLGDENVYRLAKIGCTMKEIADYFGCSVMTVSNKWREPFKKGRAVMKQSIRRRQLKRAQDGSDAMLIHLGKAYLNQSYRVRFDVGIRPQPVRFESGSDGRDPGLLERIEIKMLEAASDGSEVTPEDEEIGRDPNETGTMREGREVEGARRSNPRRDGGEFSWP